MKLNPAKIKLSWYYFLVCFFIILGIITTSKYSYGVWVVALTLLFLMTFNWLIKAIRAKEKLSHIIFFTIFYFFALKFLILINIVAILFATTSVIFLFTAQEKLFNPYGICFALGSYILIFISVKVLNRVVKKNG